MSRVSNSKVIVLACLVGIIVLLIAPARIAPYAEGFTTCQSYLSNGQPNIFCSPSETPQTLTWGWLLGNRDRKYEVAEIKVGYKINTIDVTLSFLSAVAISVLVYKLSIKVVRRGD